MVSLRTFRRITSLAASVAIASCTSVSSVYAITNSSAQRNFHAVSTIQATQVPTNQEFR